MRGALEREAVVELHEITCCRDGALLRQVSLRLAPGSFNVVVGDAGSGLLLRLASLLEPPEAGDVFLLGESTGGLGEPARDALRSRHFGFVFSSPCLLPGLSAAENVAMPLFKVLGLDAADASERTAAALKLVGLESLHQEAIDDLARFDQQRVALARAVAHRPAVLVLDRADAGLDESQAAHLLEAARRSREEFGVTVLTTFPSEGTSRRSDRILAIEGGVICRDTACTSRTGTHEASAS